jgi:oxygen-independent coproporphyrinogen-3 oxidase
MQMAGRIPLFFDTLYIGGGTPSVLGDAEISRIIETAFTYFRIQSDAEITLEVNPGTVTRKNFREFRNSGINRLNIGIQSFHDENLRFLGRIHTGAEAMSSLDWARQAGFDNIGLDLIYALPNQEKKNWLGDLARAVENEPQHLSCYMLICESGTRLDRDVKKGRVRMPTDKRARALFDTTIDFLTTHGYLHYEISNFAGMSIDNSIPRMSRHNRKYWSFAPYVGLGPSAHSFVEPKRYWNHRSMVKYVRDIHAGKLPIAETETLSKEQMIVETIYLGFRTIEGIDLNAFHRKFALNFQEIFKDTLAELKENGLIKISKTNCALSRKGLPFLDSIAVMFID